MTMSKCGVDTFARLLVPVAICAVLTSGSVLAQTPTDVEAARKARAERAAQLRAERAARKSAKSAKSGKATPAPEVPPPTADEEQLRTAERVHYGEYECEFNQRLQVHIDQKYAGYARVQSVGVDFLMKPVASQTGAIRLEDVKQVGLLLQIAGKSMLMNVKTGQRLIDSCVHPEQRKPVSN